MCLKATLDRMLNISQILTELSLYKMNTVGEKYLSDKYSGTSGDAMESESSSEETATNEYTQKVIEVFVYILDFILAPSENPKEEKVISENSNSYLKILQDSILGIPGFKKQKIDQQIEDKYSKAYNKLELSNNTALSTKLLLCKRTIFE